jgi:ribosomal protein S18 acetylase RimI-like enzyme
MEIREFDASRDLPAIRECFIELHEFERRLAPGRSAGDQIADAYLDLMFRRCREFEGSVLVAEEVDGILGFVTIWARYRSTEPDDDPAEHGYISDLVVTATRRGAGIGRALLRAAEARARAAGAQVVRLSVLAENHAARAFYRDEGFEDSEIVLEKRLR